MSDSWVLGDLPKTSSMFSELREAERRLREAEMIQTLQAAVSSPSPQLPTPTRCPCWSWCPCDRRRPPPEAARPAVSGGMLGRC